MIELHCVEEALRSVCPEEVFIKPVRTESGFVIWVSQSKKSRRSRVLERLGEILPGILSAMANDFDVSVKSGPALAQMNVVLK